MPTKRARADDVLPVDRDYLDLSHGFVLPVAIRDGIVMVYDGQL